MKYQEMIVGKQPYYVNVGDTGFIEDHRHPELELCYCVEGSCTYRIGGNAYTLKKNDLAVVGSMVSHSVDACRSPDIFTLVIEISPVLLMEFFEQFSRAVFPDPVKHIERCDPQIRELLEETVQLCQNRTDLTELLIKGNLYKLSAYIYRAFAKERVAGQPSTSFREISKVELAMEMIRNRYAEPLSVAYVASVCQYSESNFCKIFKKITGATFHDILNRRRVENACVLLKESNNTIAEIGLHVGLGDAKTFCRVFKKYTGYTPGGFRNNSSVSLKDFHL